MHKIFKNKIVISKSTGVLLIPVTDILYCQAQSSYCKIVLKNGTRHLVSKTLKRTQSILDPADFIKVHQSYLVNMNAITAIEDNLILNNNTSIPISRSNRKEVLEKVYSRYAVL